MKIDDIITKLEKKTFNTVHLREGYAMKEVDDFLDELHQGAQLASREVETLRGQLSASASGIAAQATQELPKLVDDAKVVGEQPSLHAIALLLKQAEDTAAKLIADAKQQAAGVLAQARSDGDQALAEAHTTAAGVRADAEASKASVLGEAVRLKNEIIGAAESERVKIAAEVDRLKGVHASVSAALKGALGAVAADQQPPAGGAA